MGIAVLGPLAINGDGRALAPRDRVVLAALALHPGEALTAERLADALWGERPPASWTKVVPGCVMRLRKVLGAESIETTPHGYRLLLPIDEVDSHRFERLVRRGRELLTLGEPERAAYVLGEALALWQGRALIDLEDWEPGRVEADRLGELRLDAEEFRLEASMRAGRYREVLGETQKRVAEAPLRERRWALLALAQYQAGRQADALRTLHRSRTVLAAELGLDPGPDLVALEQAILRQDPSLVAHAVLPEPSAACPYLGLVPYDIGDGDAFFGRDAVVAASLHSLAARGVLAVVGPSGSGKSSLVRAGVAAALQRDGRPVVVVNPGAHPLDALTVVSELAPRAVLVVDQCEEAVTLCDDPDEQAEFFAALTAHAERGPLVVALRADRLGALSSHPGFARLVERNLHLLTAMGEADLRAAIEGPARQAGLLLEPGLVDLLVHEVEGEPGALPLLSHALRQTWERREGRTLTVAGYRETGGIRGAVAQSAEEVYGLISGEQRPMLRDLLLRLVSPTPDGEPVRSRVPRRVVGGDAEHEQLIELLVGARLLTSDDGVVEVAHESLARAWPRLRAWLDDDVDGQRIMRHLTMAAENWEAMGRPDSELYRGVRLAQAVDWRDRAAPDLNAAERDFLDAAEQLGEAERRAATEQARRQRHTTRRLRVLVAGVAVLLVAALVAGLLALRQHERADTAGIAADARRVAAQSRDADSIDEALLLAVEAVRLNDSPDTRASLLAALSGSPALIGSALSEDARATVDVSPDGAVVAAGTEFHDAKTLDRLGALEVLPWKVAYRSDGEQVAVAISTWSPSGKVFAPVPVLLIDPTTFEPQPVQLGGLPDGSVEAWDLEYSADGRFLAVALDVFNATDFDSSVMVWDVAAPERPTQTIETGQVWAVTISPDGSLLYVGTHDPPALTIYDVATALPVRSVGVTAELAPGTIASDSAADGLELSGDGTTIAVMDGNEIALLDAVTLTERERLRGHSALVNALQFSHDGTLLASGSDDQTAVVWDLATGAPRERLQGHADSVWGLAFSPDDATLYSASIDGRLLAWDLRGDRRFISFTTPFDPGGIAAYALPAPDGETVVNFSNAWASNEAGSTIRFLDVVGGQLGDPIVRDHATWSPTWQPPHAERLAVVLPDGSVQVWDRRRGEVVAEGKVATGDIAGISYTTDGGRIVIGERSGVVFQIDAETLEPTGPRVDVGGQIRDVVAGPQEGSAFALVDQTFAMVDFSAETARQGADFGFSAQFADVSTDGRWLAVGGTGGEVGVVDVAAGEWASAPKPEGHSNSVLRVSYSPDGATFTTSGFDGRVVLWNGRTGELLATVLPGRSNAGTVAEFVGDGGAVVITDIDGAVYRWDTRLDYWVEFACHVAGRDLTDDEWRDAFGDRAYRATCSH